MDYDIETFNLTKEFIQTKSLFSLFLHSLCKEKTILAINGANLKVKQGELFGLVGPNGAGKTTLIKLLCCLILPTSGRVKVAGYDILRRKD